MNTQDHPARPRAYGALSPDELILRDRLAIDRTILANERTLLAYARTALALFIAGFSLIQLPYLNLGANFGVGFYAVAGWFCVGVGVLVMGIGYRHYRQYRTDIRAAGALRSNDHQSSPRDADIQSP